MGEKAAPRRLGHTQCEPPRFDLVTTRITLRVVSREAAPRPHGRFLAADVGEMAGVSGTTIGQWARRGYIRSSQSEGEPRVYSMEDILEAAIVHALLDRGVRHADIRRAIERLRDYGRWPLSEAWLGTARVRGRPSIVLRDDGDLYVLGARGWQSVAVPPPVEEVRLRLARTRTATG
jgi:DNA-binding transcriptional MerR regulator